MLLLCGAGTAGRRREAERAQAAQAATAADGTGCRPYRCGAKGVVSYGASGVRLRLPVSKVGQKRAQGSFIRHLLHGKGCMLHKPCQTQETIDAFCLSLLP